MDNLIFLGLNSLLLLFAWRVVFKPALRHYVRDKIFDAREDLRVHFLKEGGLDHPAYAFLRNLLNHHIRFIEDQSLCKMIHFRATMASDSQTADYIHKRFEALQDHCGEEFAPILATYRKRANRWVKFYLVHSSFCLSIFFYLTVLVAIVCSIPALLRHARTQPAHPMRRTYVRRVDETFDDEAVESYPTASVGQPTFA